MPEIEPMSTPSDYNRVLQESIRRKDKLREALARIKELETEVTTLKGERDEYAEALVSIGDEYEQLQATANAEPNELQSRIAELQRELLVRDRTAEFNKLAKEKGIKDDHFEDAIKLLGWKPDGDDFDPAKLGESLDGLVGRFPLFKGETAPAIPNGQQSQGGAQQTQRTAPRPPGPGAYRGGIPTPAKGIDAQLAERYPDPSRLA